MFRDKNHNSEIITGLDIGSSMIRVAVGQLTQHGQGQTDLQIIGTTEAPSAGIQKGSITSIEEAVSSISQALEDAERVVGVPISHAWVGISGSHILSQESRGVIAVANSRGEISDDDVERVIEAARTVAAPLNYDVLHIIPRSFTVDGQTGVKDPVGMTGVRLEVDAQIIYGATSHLNNITKAVYRTGIEIDAVVLSVLATAELILTPRQKELGVVVVDIGGSTTTLVVYEEGNIIHTTVLPIGSNHITNDLALGLQTSIDLAENIKVMYGQCVAKDVGKKEAIRLSDVGGNEGEDVSKEYVVEIIGARVMEILERINKECAVIHRNGMLPAGVVFTGGGAKIPGLVDLAKQMLRMNASIGTPMGVRSATDKIHDISFTNAISLVAWGAEQMKEGNKSTRSPYFSGTGKIVEHVQKIFKFLIP